jgi:hypothetical protein
MITPQDKANELVNMYYAHSKTQAETISIVENVLLNSLCQKIDSLHIHVFISQDFDDELIKSSIQQLKWWQEVSCEVGKLKDKLPI